jgi:hypothetical protein
LARLLAAPRAVAREPFHRVDEDDPAPVAERQQRPGHTGRTSSTTPDAHSKRLTDRLHLNGFRLRVRERIPRILERLCDGAPRV